MRWAETWKPDHPLYEKSPKHVDVFTTSTPERPYRELGIIEASRGGNLSKLIAEMRKFAGERGCDALIIMGSAHGAHDTLYRGACVLYQWDATAAKPRPVARAPEPQRSCMPNATQLCYGPGACRGGQSCVADGSGYTPCDCGAEPAAPAPTSGAEL
jgi:hypothetical protein